MVWEMVHDLVHDLTAINASVMATKNKPYLPRDIFPVLLLRVPIEKYY